MGTVPATRTWVAGETVTAGLMNGYLTTPFAWILGSEPTFRAVQTVSQVLSNTTWTSITFSTEQIDRDGGHSTSVNTSRYTSQTAGWYEVDGLITWNMTGSAIVAARLTVNGTAINGSARFWGKTNNNFQCAETRDWLFLGVGDYVELQGWHAAGSSWGTEISGGDVAPSFRVRWISS